MTRILMVCLGNICRSPLAEGILRHQANEAGLALEIDSAGTSGWHAGDPPDPRSQESALQHGIDISQQRSRPFEPADFDRFDHILVMDTSNYRDVIAQSTTSTERDKVSLILNYLEPDSNRSVPDPYYGGPDGFEQVYQLLDAACDRFLKHLR